MPALMTLLCYHKTVAIYQAAVTHPYSKTTCLVVYRDGKRINFRYKRASTIAWGQAMESVVAYVDEYILDPEITWNLPGIS